MAESVERIIALANRLPLIQRLQVIQQLSAGIEGELQKSAVSAGRKPGRVLLPTDELTYRILGCAMAVHRHKGSGYREDTYQRDLAVKFAAEEMPYTAQKLSTGNGSLCRNGYKKGERAVNGFLEQIERISSSEIRSTNNT